jgi:hypothetical protein
MVMSKKSQLLVVVISTFFIISCTDNYENGMKNYNLEKHEIAQSHFNKVPEGNVNYNESQKMIATIDSILTQKEFDRIEAEHLEQKRLAKADSARRAEIAYRNRPWKTGNFVDEFGKQTGKNFIYTEVEGVFSNTATTNSKLYVKVIVSKSSIGILMREYSINRPPEKFIGNGTIQMRNSKDERITVQTRGDWHHSGGLLIEDLYSEKSASSFRSFMRRSVGNIQFVIKDKYSSSYQFTIDSTGFIQEFNIL